MIYTDSELREKIFEMLKDFETEVVEFKEANNSYSFKDIGKYFSALGNEANIRGKSEGWLIFGITNKGEFKGTDYRKSGNLQSLKKEITTGTNERLTFLDIYELTMEKELGQRQEDNDYFLGEEDASPAPVEYTQDDDLPFDMEQSM